MAHPTAPSDLTWAPDSRLVFFTAPVAPSPAAAEKKRLQDDVFAFEETNFEHEHLWVVDLDGKTTRITYGDYSVTDYTLSPSGSRIAMTRAPSPLLEHMRFSEAWVMDANGGNALRLTTNEVAESEPLISPDGTQVLFTADANERFEAYYNDKLFVIPVGGGAARVLLPEVPYQVDERPVDGRRPGRGLRGQPRRAHAVDAGGRRHPPRHRAHERRSHRGCMADATALWARMSSP